LYPRQRIPTTRRTAIMFAAPLANASPGQRKKGARRPFRQKQAVLLFLGGGHFEGNGFDVPWRQSVRPARRPASAFL